MKLPPWCTVWLLIILLANAEEEDTDSDSKIESLSSEVILVNTSEPKDSEWFKVRSSNTIPPHAFLGGQTRMDEAVYVGRCQMSPKLKVPCTAFNNTAFLVNGENTKQVYSYEVLLEATESGLFYRWTESPNGNLPVGAVTCCPSQPGEESVFTARVLFSDTDLLIGQYVPSEKVAKVAYMNRVYKFTKFEILVKVPASYRYEKWISGDPSVYTNNAVIAGLENPTHQLLVHVGRAFHKGRVYPCKAIREFCYISMQEREVKTEIFEVLVQSNGIRYEWKLKNERDNIPNDVISIGKTAAGTPIYVGIYDWDDYNIILGSVFNGRLIRWFSGTKREVQRYFILVKKEV